MKQLQEKLKKIIIENIDSSYPLSEDEIEFSIPPKRDFGDISTTIPFILAKRLKEKPFVIGNEIIASLRGKIDFVEKIKLANGGFINFFLNRDGFLKIALDRLDEPRKETGNKIIVEHTSINPNKSAHIGHLRNSCLGDTLVRALKYTGNKVEVQNYLDDTGIQVADVVWGVINYKNKTLDDLKKKDDLAAYLWDLYTEVHKIPDEDGKLKKEKDEVHKRIEDKLDPEYQMSDFISKEVIKDHIRVMEKLDIRYDLLVRESDIIALDFFKEASHVLKENLIMYLSEDPSKENCWVIRYKKENIEKIIIRSNGTVTYIGKDIAYTLWKTAQFKKDFYYKKFCEYDPETPVVITDDQKTEHFADGDSRFGGGIKVYNVIDTRQAYLQNIISQVLNDLTGQDSAEKFSHFSYEMVALTPACALEMGFDISEEQKSKNYIEVSGRKGIAIKADDLIDRMKLKALDEVRKRNKDESDTELMGIAEKIAIGALRYFMVKYNSTSVIAFDFDEVLSFEGDTGPYLQYSLVRINSILAKATDDDRDISASAQGIHILSADEMENYYNLLLQLSLMDIQIDFALKNDEISLIANYTYLICQKFNQYYHNYSFLSESDPEIKKLRMTLLMITKAKLETLFSILGIPIPTKM